MHCRDDINDTTDASARLRAGGIKQQGFRFRFRFRVQVQVFRFGFLFRFRWVDGNWEGRGSALNE